MASTRNPKIYFLRIAKLDDYGLHYITYIGPLNSVPSGWSIQMRRVVMRAAA